MNGAIYETNGRARVMNVARAVSDHPFQIEAFFAHVLSVYCLPNAAAVSARALGFPVARYRDTPAQ